MINFYPMDPYLEKLSVFIRDHHIQAEHLSFEQSCHSVAEAAQAVGAQPEDLVKNICLLDYQGQLIVAIVKGEDRVSPKQVAAALGQASPTPVPRLATPAEILEKTGYPCGGTPSFGYPATVLIDPRVLEKEVVYTGGGSENALVKLSTAELLRHSRGTVVPVRK
jgi:prolyl-tRNA editing enzyme YbaK/EbsC (Cys-tRNA(Pro) deacylase)